MFVLESSFFCWPNFSNNFYSTLLLFIFPKVKGRAWCSKQTKERQHWSAHSIRNELNWITAKRWCWCIVRNTKINVLQFFFYLFSVYLKYRKTKIFSPNTNTNNKRTKTKLAWHSPLFLMFYIMYVYANGNKRNTQNTEVIQREKFSFSHIFNKNYIIGGKFSISCRFHFYIFFLFFLTTSLHELRK